MSAFLASLQAQANLALSNPGDHLVFLGGAALAGVVLLSLVLSVPARVFTSYMRTDRGSWSVLDNAVTLLVVGAVGLLIAAHSGSLAGTEHAIQQFVTLSSSGSGS